MPCSKCGAETVVATRTENVAHLNLCLTHLADALGNAALNPPYRFSGEVFTGRGAATRAWPQGTSLAAQPKTRKPASSRA